MSASIMGDKGHLRIIMDGREIAWFEQVRFDEADESQQFKSFYVGSPKPEVDTQIMGYNGTISGEIKNEAVDDMMQVIRDARQSGAAYPRITLVYTQQYPDGGLAGDASRTTVFTDVHFTSSSSTGGSNEKISKNLSFSAGEKRLLEE